MRGSSQSQFYGIYMVVQKIYKCHLFGFFFVICTQRKSLYFILFYLIVRMCVSTHSALRCEKYRTSSVHRQVNKSLREQSSTLLKKDKDIKHTVAQSSLYVKQTQIWGQSLATASQSSLCFRIVNTQREEWQMYQYGIQGKMIDLITECC